MSEMVPRVATSVYARHSFGSPLRRPSSCASFSATPAPASSRDTLCSSSLGSHTGTPSGTSSAGSWWSVTTTSIPWVLSQSTSALDAMPLSTVTMRSGWQPSMTRASASRERP
jgi:hypothetical protein